MIYRKGDLLAVTEGIIVHGCNAQGVMGSGVAKLIRNKYPGAYDSYKNHLHTHSFSDLLDTMGTVDFYNVPDKNLVIANAITQYYYGGDNREVSYDAIDDAFRFIAINSEGQPIHIPKIGAGLANGNWKVIEQIILQYDLDVTCWVLE